MNCLQNTVVLNRTGVRWPDSHWHFAAVKKNLAMLRVTRFSSHVFTHYQKKWNSETLPLWKINRPFVFSISHTFLGGMYLVCWQILSSASARFMILANKCSSVAFKKVKNRKQPLRTFYERTFAGTTAKRVTAVRLVQVCVYIIMLFAKHNFVRKPTGPCVFSGNNGQISPTTGGRCLGTFPPCSWGLQTLHD